jgi:hypothetical protein
MVKSIKIIIISILFSGCAMYLPLKLKKESYNGKELKINGYFYAVEKNYQNVPIGSIIVLYQNGIFSYEGSHSNFSEKNLVEYETAISKKDKKPFWSNMGKGIFQIKEDKIIIEYWHLLSHRNIEPIIIEGTIINDTTFISSILGGKNDWKFRPFPYKPDSTCCQSPKALKF